MPSVTEDVHSGGFLLSEAAGNRARERKTLASGQNLKAGAVVGAVLAGTATTGFVGTGNGVITMDATTPVKPPSKVGAYTATLVTAAVNGGTFRVEDPDGYVLGDVAVGATFDDDIKFVIADGVTDFVVGDRFTITVAAGTGKLKALTVAATDGTQLAVGVLWASTDASAADVACAIIARDAEVNGNELVWPAGISAPNKATAIAQLAALGIIVR